MNELVTPQQIEFFRENGYLYYGPIISPEDLAAVKAEVQSFIDNKQKAAVRRDLGAAGETPAGQENFLQIVGLWRSSPVLRRAATDPKRGKIIAALLGCEKVRLLSDMVLSKPRSGSRATYWHQDYPNHPNSLPDVTAWMALGPTTLANGCMQYVPGSHKWGELMGYDHGDGQNYLRKGVDVSGAVAVEMQPGEVVFHHSLTVHYAGPNTTDQPRMAYICRYMPAESRYRRAELVYGGQADESLVGQLFGDQDHPVLG